MFPVDGSSRPGSIVAAFCTASPHVNYSIRITDVTKVMDYFSILLQGYPRDRTYRNLVTYSHIEYMHHPRMWYHHGVAYNMILGQYTKILTILSLSLSILALILQWGPFL